MNVAVVVAGVALVAGCGDDLTPRPPHSGERLQIVRYRYEDGTEQIDRSTLYDTALGERCQPATFSDGARYCLPLSASGQALFVDERCTKVVGLATTDAIPPFVIGTYQIGGVVRPSKIYRTGSTVVAPTLVWRQQDGYCIGPTPAQTGTYVALSAALGTDALARVAERYQVSGTDVAVGIDVGDDGLATTGALYDLERGPCELVTEPGSTEAVCIATSLVQATYFGDAACTNPLVAVEPTAQPEHASYRDDRSSCWSLLEVQEAWAADEVYERIDHACIAVPKPAGLSLRATAHAHPPPALARVRAIAGDRLDVMGLVDGAVRIPSTHVFDRELDADCTPTEREGELVCIPDVTITTTTVFADDACGTPIDLAFVPTGECEPQHAYASRGDDIVAIGAAYTQPFYELEPGDRCGTFEAPVGHVAHSIGPALPLDTFARVTVTH